MGDVPERYALSEQLQKVVGAQKTAPSWDTERDRLSPTDAQGMAHPKVRALVEALRPFDACMFTDNGDVTISTGHLSAKDWLRLRAALRDMEDSNG